MVESSKIESSMSRLVNDASMTQVMTSMIDGVNNNTTA